MLISSHVRNRADSNTVITFLSERTGVYSILQGPSGCTQERFAYLQTSALLCVGCSRKGHHEHMQRLQPPLAKGAQGAGAGQLGGSAKSNRSCCDFRGFYPVRVDERPPLGDVRNSRSHILVKSNQFILGQSGSDYKGLSRRGFAQIHTLTTFSGMFRQMMKFKTAPYFLRTWLSALKSLRVSVYIMSTPLVPFGTRATWVALGTGRENSQRRHQRNETTDRPVYISLIFFF